MADKHVGRYVLTLLEWAPDGRLTLDVGEDVCSARVDNGVPEYGPDIETALRRLHYHLTGMSW